MRGRPHGATAMGYKLGVIRELLTEALSRDEFLNLCFDHFGEVREKFTEGQERSAQVRVLVDYANRRRKLDRLLSLVKDINPAVFAEFERRLVEPQSDGPAPTSSPLRAFDFT